MSRTKRRGMRIEVGELLAEQTTRPRMEGSLRRHNPRRKKKMGKRLHFALIGRQLQWFAERPSANKPGRPLGTINIEHANGISEVKAGKFAHGFAIDMPDQQYVFYAQSADDHTQWLEGLQRAHDETAMAKLLGLGSPRDEDSNLLSPGSESESENKRGSHDLRVKMEELEMVEGRLQKHRDKLKVAESDEFKVLLLSLTGQVRGAELDRLRKMSKSTDSLERKVRSDKRKIRSLNDELQAGINQKFNWSSFQKQTEQQRAKHDSKHKSKPKSSNASALRKSPRKSKKATTPPPPEEPAPPPPTSIAPPRPTG